MQQGGWGWLVFDTGDGGGVGNGVEVMWGNLIHEEDVGNARGRGQGVQATYLLCVPVEALRGAVLLNLVYSLSPLVSERASREAPHLVPGESSVSSLAVVRRWVL